MTHAHTKSYPRSDLKNATSALHARLCRFNVALIQIKVLMCLRITLLLYWSYHIRERSCFA